MCLGTSSFSLVSLFTLHCSLPEGPQAHAARGRNGRQEGRQRGYYHLHRNFDDFLFHGRNSLGFRI